MNTIANPQSPLTPQPATPPEPQPQRPQTWWRRLGVVLWHLVVWAVRHWRISLSALCVLLLLAASLWLYRQCSDDEGAKPWTLTTQGTVTATADEIRAIRDIGQWEFLSVETEEMVEKHQARLLGDNHLVCIYRGTLRLGVDMTKAKAEWFEPDGAKAILRLPDITLLDDNFIDEARTVTFHQEGNWKADAREEMRHTAAKAMKARTMTDNNLEEARRCAREQFTKIFMALGYTGVEIYFERPEK